MRAQRACSHLHLAHSGHRTVGRRSWYYLNKQGADQAGSDCSRRLRATFSRRWLHPERGRPGLQSGGRGHSGAGRLPRAGGALPVHTLMVRGQEGTGDIKRKNI